MLSKEELIEKAKKIKLLAFDVDGVMTDGSVTFDENGVEYKTFNVKDGYMLNKMGKLGFITSIITARNNGTVEHRAKNLEIVELYQGQKYKLPALEEMLEKYNLTYENVSYMGDDLLDLCVLNKVGLSCCPADAVDEVIEECDFVSTKNGGRGAVRELCDFVLSAQGFTKEEIIAVINRSQ